MIRLALFLAILAGAVAAQDVKRPALYDVVGVAANDVLNLRAQPSAGASLVGALEPNARNVEVVAVDDTSKWGLVALPEGAGWASLRFLARQGGQDAARMPLPLRCGGTEPFWSMTLDAGQIRFRQMDGGTVSLPSAVTGPPVGRSGYAYGFVAGSALSGVVERRACSDGMSDRPFGLSVFVLRDGGDGPSLFEGCCSLGAR